MVQLFTSIIILWFLPGFFLLAALFPRKEQITSWERIAFSIPASMAVSSLVGLFLSKFFLLKPLFIVCSVSFIVLLLLAIALFRGYKFSLYNPIKIKQSYIKNWPLIMIIFFMVGSLSFFLYKNPLPKAHSTLGYIYQAFQIYKAGGLPDSFLEWNGPQAVIINKILFNLSIAEFFSLNNLDIFLLTRVALIILFIGIIFSAVAFLRLFFSPFITSMLLSSLFSFPILLGFSFSNKINSLRGEPFAYPLMFFIFWLGWQGFYRHKRQKKWLAVILLPVVNLIHGVTGIISVLFLMAISLTGVFLQNRKRLNNLLWFLLIPIVFLFGSQMLMKATGKELAYSKTIRAGKYQSVNGEDPTWLFYKMLKKDVDRFRPIEPYGFYGGFRENSKKIVQSFSLFNIISVLGVIIIAIARLPFHLVKEATFRKIINSNTIWYVNLCMSSLSAIALGWIIKKAKEFDKDFFYSLVVWIFFSLAIVGLSLLFLWRYSTYLPASHFLRREVKFIIFLPLFAWGSIMSFLALKSKIKRSLLNTFKIFTLSFLILASVASHFYSFSLRPSLSEDGLVALQWLKGKVPQNNSVLSNQRTTGSIGLIAYAAGVLDGRAPYLQPDLLYDALDKMISARPLYIEGENIDILDEERVAYVLVAPDGELGGHDITHGKYNLEMLSTHPRLKLKKTFGKVFIYEVGK